MCGPDFHTMQHHRAVPGMEHPTSTSSTSGKRSTASIVKAYMEDTGFLLDSMEDHQAHRPLLRTLRMQCHLGQYSLRELPSGVRSTPGVHPITHPLPDNHWARHSKRSRTWEPHQQGQQCTERHTQHTQQSSRCLQSALHSLEIQTVQPEDKD